MRTGFLNAFIGSSLISFLGIFGSISIGQHIGTLLARKTTLKHLSPYEGNGYVIADLNEIKNQYNSIRRVSNPDYTGKEKIKKYMQALKKHVGTDIKLAEGHISTLTLQKKKSMAFTGTAGEYDGGKNTISYISEDATIMSHELLHMASFMQDSKTGSHYYGFMQYRNKAEIGRGLNEGYTELLSGRIFHGGKTNSYARLVRIAKLIEEFFPTPKDMEHAYFTCNLPQLVRTMETYCTREEVMNIILGMDEIYAYEKVIGSPIPIIKETQIAKKLYELYARHYASEPAKVEAFKKKASENKLVGMTIAGKKMKLTRQNPFTRIKNGIQHGFRKVKSFFTGQPAPAPAPAYCR